MKNDKIAYRLLIIWAILYPLSMGAQSVYPTRADNPKWKLHISLLSGIVPAEVKIWGSTDTLVNGKSYIRVLACETRHNSSLTQGAYRIEGKKVFYLSYQSATAQLVECLMLDFGAAIGDTLKFCPYVHINDKLVVQSIDSVVIEQIKRRRVNLRTIGARPYIIEWVEGLGHTRTTWYDGAFFFTEDGHLTYPLVPNFPDFYPRTGCYSENAQIRYRNPYPALGDLCNLTATEDLSIAILKIAPNPNHGHFRLDYDTDIPNKTLTINLFNCVGQLILNQSIQPQQEIYLATEGVYFLRYEYQGRFFTKKIIVAQ